MHVNFPDVHVIVEGVTDEAIVTKLLRYTEITSFQIQPLGGKSNIVKRLSGYNRSAESGSNWLVVVDLDHDAICAPQHMRQVLKCQIASERLHLRIAVRSIESWLLADVKGMASFTGIRAARFTVNPEREDHPKRYLVDLIDKECRKKGLRKGLLPPPRSKRAVGPGYTYLIERFAMKYWRPEVAAERSESLARCIRALENLKRQSAQ